MRCTPEQAVSRLTAVTGSHLFGTNFCQLVFLSNIQVICSHVSACSAQSDGEQYRRTGVQLQGVLDSLYFYEGSLGARQAPEGAWSISLWAPTAQRVSLELFEGPRGGSAQQIAMQRGDKGQWTAQAHSGLRIHPCMTGLHALQATQAETHADGLRYCDSFGGPAVL